MDRRRAEVRIRRVMIAREVQSKRARVVRWLLGSESGL